MGKSTPHVAPLARARQSLPAQAAFRLLKRLAEPGIIAERRDGAVQLLRRAGTTFEPCGTVPNEALAPLVESGAVLCRMDAGRPRFSISEAGRAALFRLEERPGTEAEPNRFGDQHRVIASSAHREGEELRTLRFNLAEDPLALLARQKDGFAREFIGAAALEAGKRLQRDMAIGQIEPKMTVDLTRVSVDGGMPGGMLSLSEQAMVARERVRRALLAVGPDHAGVLTDVCGFSKGLERVESERRLPARSAKVWLGLALRALARHYGLDEEARGRAGGPIRVARAQE